jgi:phosphoribosylformylglycinamidine synthase
MPSFDVQVEVRHKAGISDPAGATIERSLPALGFGGIRGVTVGKSIRFRIDADDADAARAEVEDLCRRFLTNPVIEDSSIVIETASVGVA